MKVLNICVNGIYTDGYTYHENLLPKYHAQLGHDVYLLASEYEFDCEGKIRKAVRKDYIDENGVRVIRLRIKGDKDIGSKFKRFEEFYETIETINPDIIFCHLFQFLDIKKVIEYKKKHANTYLYLDSHADYINSARNFWSKNILHKVIWKYCAQVALPYVEKIYGVLPARVEFLREVYGIPAGKTELLVMGVDDDLAFEANNAECVELVRKKLGVESSDFMIVTGGRINKDKQEILLLMQAMRELDVKLIVFGPVSEDIRENFEKLCNDKVIYIGWISASESYKLFAASNLVVFPSTHSVYWEQVVGQGIPMVARYWKGIEHIDIGGNVRFLYGNGREEMVQLLRDIVWSEEYNSMLESAKGMGKEQFSYYQLAKKSIEREREDEDVRKI